MWLQRHAGPLLLTHEAANAQAAYRQYEASLEALKHLPCLKKVMQCALLAFDQLSGSLL